jgi:TetR/AcrR family transcriptional regulator
LRIAATQGRVPANADFSAGANVLVNFALGHWHSYAKSGFTRDPVHRWPQQWAMLRAACMTIAPLEIAAA